LAERKIQKKSLNKLQDGESLNGINVKRRYSMNKQSTIEEEQKKDDLIDNLMKLGVFKLQDLQLYQVSLEVLKKEYKKRTN